MRSPWIGWVPSVIELKSLPHCHVKTDTRRMSGEGRGCHLGTKEPRKAHVCRQATEAGSAQPYWHPPTLNFWPPEVWDDEVLLFWATSLWCFLMVTPENEYRNLPWSPQFHTRWVDGKLRFDWWSLTLTSRFLTSTPHCPLVNTFCFTLCERIFPLFYLLHNYRFLLLSGEELQDNLPNYVFKDSGPEGVILLKYKYKKRWHLCGCFSAQRDYSEISFHF